MVRPTLRKSAFLVRNSIRIHKCALLTNPKIGLTPMAILIDIEIRRPLNEALQRGKLRGNVAVWHRQSMQSLHNLPHWHFPEQIKISNLGRCEPVRNYHFSASFGILFHLEKLVQTVSTGHRIFVHQQQIRFDLEVGQCLLHHIGLKGDIVQIRRPLSHGFPFFIEELIAVFDRFRLYLDQFDNMAIAHDNIGPNKQVVVSKCPFRNNHIGVRLELFMGDPQCLLFVERFNGNIKSLWIVAVLVLRHFPHLIAALCQGLHEWIVLPLVSIICILGIEQLGGTFQSQFESSFGEITWFHISWLWRFVGMIFQMRIRCFCSMRGRHSVPFHTIG